VALNTINQPKLKQETKYTEKTISHWQKSHKSWIKFTSTRHQSNSQI